MWNKNRAMIYDGLYKNSLSSVLYSIRCRSYRATSRYAIYHLNNNFYWCHWCFLNLTRHHCFVRIGT